MASIARLIKRVKSRLQNPVYGYEHWQSLGTQCDAGNGIIGQGYQCLTNGPEICEVWDTVCLP